jgi:AraC-like DNA-binding protein
MLTDYRIGYATQLLQNTGKSVAEVCYESGFGNLSHFNKQFKLVTNHSPLQYRKAFALR